MIQEIQRKEFQPNGCSGGLSKVWTLLTGSPPPFEECCCVHDYAYWLGGSNMERKDSDIALRRCIAGTGHPIMAWITYAAVRFCGGSYFLFHGNHKWGYGIMSTVDKLLAAVKTKNIVEDAVRNIEETSKTINAAVNGTEKRAAGIEILVNEIKIPFIPKWLLRYVLGKAIDAMVKNLNNKFGNHTWDLFGSTD